MLILYALLLVAFTQAQYNLPIHGAYKGTPRQITPTTNEELVKALCSKEDSSGYCMDDELKIIVLTKIFDFTNTEGQSTEEGCYHLSTPECLAKGQKKLNVNNQCAGLTKVSVTYDKAGIKPLKVGSNKYIVSKGGGLKGKGLKVCHNKNVFISGLSITDINAHLIWGGDAITLDNATNVWIHNNYISRIGRQMIVTGFGACKNITISNNEFDGRTPTSAYCDGLHYWLWLFLGQGDTITLYNNYVHHTSGRGPHVTGMNNASVLLHMVKNRFENVKHAGLVEAHDSLARVLIEGNTFKDVSNIISKNGGRLYYPQTAAEAAACKPYLGRNCYLNTAVSCGLSIKSDSSVLREFSGFDDVDTDNADAFVKAIVNIRDALTNQQSFLYQNEKIQLHNGKSHHTNSQHARKHTKPKSNQIS